MWCCEANKDTRFEYGRRDPRSRRRSKSKNSSQIRGSAYSNNSSARRESTAYAYPSSQSRRKSSAMKVTDAFSPHQNRRSSTPNGRRTQYENSRSTQKNMDTQAVKFSEMTRNETEHLAYRELMLRRLRSVGLNEEEFEDYIRMDQDSLLNSLSEVKLKALMIVINKEDFKNNFDFSEEQYNFYERKFDLVREKEIRIHDPSFNKLAQKVEERGFITDDLNESSIYSLPRFGSKDDNVNNRDTSYGRKDLIPNRSRDNSVRKLSIPNGRRSSQGNVFKDITNTEQNGYRKSVFDAKAETAQHRLEKETTTGYVYPPVNQLEPYPVQNEVKIPSFGNSVVPNGGNFTQNFYGREGMNENMYYEGGAYGGNMNMEGQNYASFEGNSVTPQQQGSEYQYYSQGAGLQGGGNMQGQQGQYYAEGFQGGANMQGQEGQYYADGFTQDGEPIFDIDPNNILPNDFEPGPGPYPPTPNPSIRPNVQPRPVQPNPNIRPNVQPRPNPPIQPRPAPNNNLNIRPNIQPRPSPQIQPRPSPNRNPNNLPPPPQGYQYDQNGFLEPINQNIGPHSPSITIHDVNPPVVPVVPVIPVVPTLPPKVGSVTKKPPLYIQTHYKDIRLLENQAPPVSLSPTPVASPRMLSSSKSPVRTVLRNSQPVNQSTIPRTVVMSPSPSPRRITTTTGNTTIRGSFINVSSPQHQDQRTVSPSSGKYVTTSPFKPADKSPYLSPAKQLIVTASPVRSPLQKIVTSSPLRAPIRQSQNLYSSSIVATGPPIKLIESTQEAPNPNYQAQNLNPQIPAQTTIYSSINDNNQLKSPTVEYGFQNSRRIPQSRVLTAIPTSVNSRSISNSRVVNVQQSTTFNGSFAQHNSSVNSRSRTPVKSPMVNSGVQKKRIRFVGGNVPRYDKVVITGENRSQSRNKSPIVGNIERKIYRQVEAKPGRDVIFRSEVSR